MSNITQYHTEGVIAFIPNHLDDPDTGTLGVFVKEDKDRLFFYSWQPAIRSKSDHILNVPVERTDPITWRLQPTIKNTDWFDPFVPTNESPVRLKHVAKTKARSPSPSLPTYDWDNLTYSSEPETDNSPVVPTTDPSPPPTLNDSSASLPHE